ncbi:MAG: NAD(P)-binding protein [Campylobacterales bacterium]|nr:NAD(P)-binding protein [Campylobacterales bacterium]
MFDYAVVGSGVGGSSIAALLSKKGYRVVLFEKDANLGGCSGSFYHNGYLYNAGATTLAGYEEGYIVKEIFDAIGFVPDIKECDISMEVIHGAKRIKRYKDLNLFLEEIERSYPHEKNEDFWKLVYSINQEFYKVGGYRYTNRSFFAKVKSLFSFLPVAFKFGRYIFVNAEDFIEKFYGQIDQEYREFLEAQVLIVAQAKLKEINFFTAAVSLAYTFNKNYHAVGGFKKLFLGLTKNVDTVLKKTEVQKIRRLKDHFHITTSKQNYLAKNVILNSTVYESAELFEEQNIKREFSPFKKLDNHQGTFVVYMTLKTDKKFLHHYQLIKQKNYTHAISNSVFVSFADDFKEGYVSVTASVHTDYRIWYDSYQEKKEQLEDEIFEDIVQSFDIELGDVLDHFSATPQTFKRYINREQAGGNPITMKNFILKLPANDTGIKGVYRVGDTTFAAQGWPGVMMGVKNLSELIECTN